MKLAWNRLPDGSAEVATGKDWTYLLMGKPGGVLLTRCEPPGTSALAAAVQGAVNAIKVHADRAPAPYGADMTNARRLAQKFEDGESLFGVPAWQHEADPAPRPYGWGLPETEGL